MLHAGWFIIHNPGEFINCDPFIELKGSEGRRCLEEGCLGLPGAFLDLSRTAIFAGK